MIILSCCISFPNTGYVRLHSVHSIAGSDVMSSCLVPSLLPPHSSILTTLLCSRSRNSFFCGSKLLLPGARPGSKTNFVVAKLYVNFVRHENIPIL